MQITPLEIDYREPTTTVVDFVEQLGQELVVPRSKLSFGDLFWITEQASYGVELKSVSDFIHSLWSHDQGERLEWQLDGLRKLVDVPLLAIHGIFLEEDGYVTIYDAPTQRGDYLYARRVASTRWLSVGVEGFLASVQHQGVQLMMRPTKQRLIEALSSFYTKSAEEEHTVFGRHTKRYSTHDESPLLEQRINTLLGVRGLGEKRARVLLQKFGAPIDILLASDKELLAIDGIGVEMVKKLREVFHG